MLLLLVLSVASDAAAEVVSTAQARDASATFLVSTPVAPNSAAAICVVDTGAELTPDTGSLQARISLWDDQVGDTSPTLHGTHVVTLIAAARNDWGMVGIWPAARVVSVRANANGEDRFTVASYYQGLRRCHGLAAYYSFKVVLLALGSASPLTDEEQAALSDEIASARQHGLSVVAAAGNNDGGPLQTPAQLPGVLSVGGSSADGSRCAISAVGARLQAPGCGLDAIDANGVPVQGVYGTTEAATVTAASLAALRSYRPDLGPDAAEQLLVSSATPSAGGPRLNVAAAFQAAGRGDVVASAPPLEPPAETVRSTSPPPLPSARELPDLAPPRSRSRLPRPRASARRQAGRPRRLVVRVRNRPSSATVDLTVRPRAPRTADARRRGARPIARRRSRADAVRLRVPARAALSVTIRYVDPSRARAASRPVVLRVRPVRERRR